jgi:hypothetical protein
MRQHTQGAWKNLCFHQFGFREGNRKVYASGVALKKRPIALSLPPQPQDLLEGAFDGSCVLAKSEGLVVLASDWHDHDVTSYVPRYPIQIRHAKGLNVIDNIESAANVWAVAICGPRGCEIIVYTTFRTLIATRGTMRQVLDNSGQEKTKLLGSPAHLLVFLHGNLTLYRPAAGSDSDVLLVNVWSAPIYDPQLNCQAVAWSSDDFPEFACSVPGNEILLWSFHDGIPVIDERNCVCTLDSCDHESIAVNSLYLVVATARTTVGRHHSVHVWNRETKTLVQTINDRVHPRTDSVHVELSGKWLLTAFDDDGYSLGIRHLETDSYRLFSILNDDDEDGGSAPCLLQMHRNVFLTVTSKGEVVVWAFCASSNERGHFESMLTSPWRGASRRTVETAELVNLIDDD